VGGKGFELNTKGSVWGFLAWKEKRNLTGG